MLIADRQLPKEQSKVLSSNKILKEKSVEKKFAEIVGNRFSAEILKVILFGSRAKGVAAPDSDYDILIILKRKNQSVVDGIYDEVMNFLERYEVDISLKIYTEDAFNKMMLLPTPFMAQIKKTGIELWSQPQKN